VLKNPRNWLESSRKYTLPHLRKNAI